MDFHKFLCCDLVSDFASRDFLNKKCVEIDGKQKKTDVNSPNHSLKISNSNCIILIG